MEFLFTFLPALLIPLAISLIQPWIRQKSTREKEEDGRLTRTKAPRNMAICAWITLIFMLLLFAAIAILFCCLESDFSKDALLAYCVCAILLLPIPLLWV